MHISTEGKIQIAIGLLALGGAGAMMAFPTQLWIGWALILFALVGGAALLGHHFRDKIMRVADACLGIATAAAVVSAFYAVLGFHKPRQTEGVAAVPDISSIDTRRRPRISVLLGLAALSWLAVIAGYLNLSYGTPLQTVTFVYKNDQQHIKPEPGRTVIFVEIVT